MNLLIHSIVSIAIAILVLVLYSPTLTSPPLIDDQTLLAAWSHAIAPGAYGMGIDPRDLNLSVGNALAHFLSGSGSKSGAGLIKAMSVCMHAFNAIALYLIIVCLMIRHKSRRIDREQIDLGRASLYGSITALLYAVNPLANEAVSSLNGLPVMLGTAMMMLGALAISLYKDRAPVWVAWLGAIMLIGSLFCNAHTAVLGLILGLLLTLSRSSSTSNLSTRLMCALIILSALSCSVWASVQTSSLQAPALMRQLSEKGIESALYQHRQMDLVENFAKNATTSIFAVNKRANQNSYKKIYRNLAIDLILILLWAIAGLILSPRGRVLSGIALAAWIIALCGAYPMQIDTDTLYGARWLYPSLIGPALLFGAALGALPAAQNQSKLAFSIKGGIAALLAASLLVLQSMLTYTNAMSYKANAKTWQTIAQSAAMVASREKSSHVIVRDLPQTLAVAPIISPFNLYVLEIRQKGKKSEAIIANYDLPPEAYRNYVRESQSNKQISLHYEKNFGGLIRIDFAPPANTNFASKLDLVGLLDKLNPPLAYYKDAIKVDAIQKCLVMESNNQGGLGIPLECWGLDPLATDAIYIEAKIDGGQPQEGEKEPKVDLHWLTNWQTDWEHRDRYASCSAVVSDGHYHRYRFSTINNAFSTNGYPSRIMFGFPAGCRVFIRQVGWIGKEHPDDTCAAKINLDCQMQKFDRDISASKPGCLYLHDGPDNNMIAAKATIATSSDTSTNTGPKGHFVLEISPMDLPTKSDRLYPEGSYHNLAANNIALKPGQNGCLLQARDFNLLPGESSGNFSVTARYLDDDNVQIGTSSNSYLVRVTK